MKSIKLFSLTILVSLLFQTTKDKIRFTLKITQHNQQ